MAVNFQQTDTNAAQTNAQCSPNLQNSTTTSCQASSGGTPGSSERTASMEGSGVDRDTVWQEVIDIDDYDGAAGDWTTRINVTTANHQLVLDTIYICHVASDYSNKGTIGSVTGLADNLNDLGVRAHVVNQASPITIAAGDKIVIIYGFDNLQAMANTLGWTPDQLIEGPGAFAAGTFTGTSAITTGSVTASGSGSFTPPSFTGTAAITTGSVTASASGTFTAPVPTFTGSAAITTGSVGIGGTALVFTQTSTAPSCAMDPFCSGGTNAGDSGFNVRSLCVVGATPSETPQTFIIPASGTNQIGVQLELVPDTDAGTAWNAGTWTVRLNNGTSEPDSTWDSVHICRVNSACTNQETVGSTTGLGISLGSTGVKTATVAGAAQSPATGDKIQIICIFSTVSGNNDFPNVIPNQDIDTPLVGPVPGTFTPPTFTGSLDVTLGGVAVAASGTFAAAGADHTGSAAITTGSTLVSASGTFTAPVYTGTSAASVGSVVVSASGQHTAPTFTGTSAITTGSTTLAGSGVFTAPIYTGSSAATTGSVTLTGSATFTAPIYSGSASLAVGSVVASATGTFAVGVVTGSAAITVGSPVAAASGTFEVPVYTGTAAITTGSVLLSASGNTGSPTFTGTGTITTGAVTLASSGAFTAPVFTGSASLATGSVIATGSGTFAVGVVTGSATITIGSTVGAASGTFTAPVYTGSSAISVGSTSVAGSGTFATALFTGSATITIGSSTAAGSGSYTAPVYTGAGSLVSGGAQVSGSGTHQVPVFTGTAAPTLGAAVAAGSGTFAVGVKTGSAIISIGSTTLLSSGTFTAPVYTGSAALSVGSVTVTAAGFLFEDVPAVKRVTKTAVLHLATPQLVNLATLAGDEIVTLDDDGLAALQGSASNVVKSKARVYLSSSKQAIAHLASTKQAEVDHVVSV